MTTVHIDRASALFYIRPASRRYQGCYYFCPECADARGAGFRYLEASRAWNPCQHYNYAMVPTLRPDVELRELFEQFVAGLSEERQRELHAQSREILTPDNPQLLTDAERRQWEQYVHDARMWLTEQWRLALNDLPNELGWTARDVWGARRNDRGEYVIQRPTDMEFVWADGQ